MGKVGNAVMATGLFAAGTLGVFGLGTLESNAHSDRVAKCGRDFQGDAEKTCIDNIHDNDAADLIEILEYAGGIAVIGSGYLVYKAVKEENETTGLVEDLG